MYTTAASEDEREHATLIDPVVEEEAAEAAKVKPAEAVTICSCGNFTCPLIGELGIPLDVYRELIEPIGDQMARDVAALRYRSAS